MAGYSEHGNEPSNIIKGREVVFSNYQLLKKDAAPCG
jgi:hypothetical protein